MTVPVSAVPSAGDSDLAEALGVPAEALADSTPTPPTVSAEATPPASPDTPPSAAAQPGEDAAAQPRNEKGQFVSSKDLSAAPPETPDTPPSDQPTDETTKAPDAPDLSAYPPLSYTSDGQKFAFEGSYQAENGVWFDADKVPHLQKLLSDGRRVEAVGRESFQRQQRLEAEFRQQMEDKDLEIAGLKDLLTLLDPILGDREKFLDFAENFEPNRDLLRTKAEAARAKREAELYRTRQAHQQSRAQADQQIPQMQQGLRHYIGDFAKHPDLAGVDVEAAYEQAWRMRNALFVTADRDDPVSGIRRGELSVDLTALGAMMKPLAEAARAKAEAQRLAALAKQQPKKPVTPPTVGSRTGPAPKVAAAKKDYAGMSVADIDRDIFDNL